MQRVLRYLCSGLEPRHPGEPATAPQHFRAPHDYGVAVILLSLADRMVPAEQADGLKNGIETYLTASQLTLVDMTRAKAVYEDSKRIGASLPEPSHTLMQMVTSRDTKGLGARLLPVLDAIEVYPPSMSPEKSPPPLRRSTCCTAPRTPSFPPSRRCCSRIISRTSTSRSIRC
jgi:hypothetical protein